MSETITNVASAVDGWKTHILAGSFIVACFVAWKLGMLTGIEAFDRIAAFAFGSTFRSAVAKLG